MNVQNFLDAVNIICSCMIINTPKFRSSLYTQNIQSLACVIFIPKVFLNIFTENFPPYVDHLILSQTKGNLILQRNGGREPLKRNWHEHPHFSLPRNNKYKNEVMIEFLNEIYFCGTNINTTIWFCLC